VGTIRRFEDIQAWQKARHLVVRVYQASAEGPLSKDYGLRNQLCRAAVSAMSNIAEGFARNTDKDFAHFLDVAKASAVEVQSLLYVALDVQYISDQQFRSLFQEADETIRLIGGFCAFLRNQRPAASARRPYSAVQSSVNQATDRPGD